MRVGSSKPQGLRGSIPGGVEMRAKGDDGGRGRGGRGTISSVLGGALSLLVELRERMVGIALTSMPFGGCGDKDYNNDVR